MNSPGQQGGNDSNRKSLPLRERLQAMFDENFPHKEQDEGTTPMPQDADLRTSDERFEGILKRMAGDELSDMKDELVKIHAQIKAYLAQCVSEGREEVSSIVEQWQTFIEFLDEIAFDAVEDIKDDLFPIIESLKKQLQSVLDRLPTKSMIDRFADRMLGIATTPMIRPPLTGNPYHPGSPIFRGLVYTFCLIKALLQYQIGADVRKAEIEADREYNNNPVAQGFNACYANNWGKLSQSTNSAAAFYEYARTEFQREFTKQWNALDVSGMSDAERRKEIDRLSYEIKFEFLKAETPDEMHKLAGRYGPIDFWDNETGGKINPRSNLIFFSSTQIPVSISGKGKRELFPTNFYYLYCKLEPSIPQKDEVVSK